MYKLIKMILPALLVLNLMLLSSSYSQQRAVGFSTPGRIGKPEPKPVPKKELIECIVQLRDETGDRMITEFEEGFILMVIKNNSDSLTVNPQLKIFSYNSESSSPYYKILFPGKVEPQKMIAIRDKIEWDGNLPTADIPYYIRITDLSGSAEPLAIEFSFETLGSGVIPLSDR